MSQLVGQSALVYPRVPPIPGHLSLDKSLNPESLEPQVPNNFPEGIKKVFIIIIIINQFV